MGEGFQFLDIILFAAVAAFLVLRLRNVLGRRTGHDESSKYHSLPQHPPADGGQDKVTKLPDRSKPAADLGTPTAPQTNLPVREGLAQIKLSDRSFNAEEFLTGAKQAFEIVVTAFSEGDIQTLRALLSNDVYEDFCGVIKARQKAKQALDSTLVGIAESEITEAAVEGRTAFITVKFVSNQINVLRDNHGNIIEGDPNKVKRITDVWTFARNMRSRDPNWTLVATASPD
jgi:predicted lipid-binding transport protein (Tim44 family)